MKHATRMAMTWHAMKNPDKRGVQRHHGSDPADMPATSCVCENSERFLFKQNLGYIGGKIWPRHRTVIAPASQIQSEGRQSNKI